MMRSRQKVTEQEREATSLSFNILHSDMNRYIPLEVLPFPWAIPSRFKGEKKRTELKLQQSLGSVTKVESSY